MTSLRKILRALFANSFFDTILKGLIYLTGRNPLLFAYNQKGILKWQNEEVNGEKFFITDFLKTHFLKKSNIVIFDVGANVGNYSKKLSSTFPKSQIYAFEPNPISFSNLLDVAKTNTNVIPFKIGFSNQSGQTEIFSYGSDEGSEHASVYKSVISEIHHDSNIKSFQIELDVIDLFCKKHNIEHIDFIKIDTEGHELSVLQGAKNMIDKMKIDIIQFEFNEMNIISRTFLKDFYELLYENYLIYRLDTKKLIPLYEYSTNNEIFQYQNIIAIKRSNYEKLSP